MTESPRRPKAIRLSSSAPVDPAAPAGPPEPAGRPLTREAQDASVRVTIEPEPASEALPPVPAPARRPRWPVSALFWGALTGLVTLSLGLALADLVEAAFARVAGLGWLAAGLAGLLVLAALTLIAREIAALQRLAKVDALRAEAGRVLACDERAAGRRLAAELTDLYAPRPDMAAARGRLRRDLAAVLDGADTVKLAERALMTDLDARATRLVMQSATRVSVVTALSPRALFDVLMVTAESARLIRALAELYGARPGRLGFLVLGRAVVGHLVVTGGLAAGESLVQQVLGHGLAAKLSAKLGEGVMNGLMTARVGLAAIDLVRPLPFTVLERPRLSAVLAELMKAG